MSKYVFGGLGLTAMGLGFQPYIKSLQPYSLYFIFGGLFIFLLPLLFRVFRWLLGDRNVTQLTGSKQLNTGGFPSVDWLTGKEVMGKYSIGSIELYQHIKNGLKVYPKDFTKVMLMKEAQPLSEYDVGFEIDYDISHNGEVYDLLKDYHFKVVDIESYKNA
ncbi:hypothetical protein KA005_29450 [bacterium]|nr:hypothetical protein [bacterium]